MTCAPSSSGRKASAAIVAAGLLAFPMVGEVGAKAPPAKGAATARYVLTVHFTGYARWEVEGGTPAPDFTEERTAWAGTSKPFVLVNRGSAAKPRIEIRSPSLGPSVAIDGFLEHRGNGEISGVVQGKKCTSIYTASTGDAKMSARVTIVSNRLRIRMTAAGNVSQRWSPDSCLGGNERVAMCPGCVSTPERLGLSSDWWSKIPLDAKLVKFGRVFTIKRMRTALVDGGQPTPPLVDYLFQWVLKFSPAKP